MTRRALVQTLLAVVLAVVSVRCAYMPAEPKTRSDPARVLVMYDGTYTGDEDFNGVQDSLQLAQFYIAARAIPEANLFSVNLTTGDYTFQLFKDTWLGPLIQHLDSIGPTTIDMFAVLWPLPSAYWGNERVVSVDSTLLRPYEYYSGSYALLTYFGYGNPYHFPNPTFATDPVRFHHAGNLESK
jgi:hypothetical protein